MILFAGVVADLPGPVLVLNTLCRSHLNARFGEYYHIESEERGTEVVRCLTCVPTHSQTRPDYAYLDATTFHLLGVSIGDRLRVSRSEICLNMP